MRDSAGVWCMVGVGAAWGVAHVVTGTPVLDLGAWIVTVVVGVLAPGVALVRAVRPRPAALVEDIGWGCAAGAGVALGGWLVDALLPWSVPPWVWGPIVVLVTLAPSRARCRVLARPLPGWGRGPTVALAAALAVAVAWMTAGNLAWVPLSPTGGAHNYYPDTLFQLALVGELGRGLDPQYPMVAGEPLSYHWFAHAVLAHLSTATTVDQIDLVLRLAPTTILPAVLVLAAVITRELSGRIAAGPLAAALLSVVGAVSITTQSPTGPALPMIQLYWWASLTQEFAWLASLGAFGCAAAWVIGRQISSTPLALLIPLLVLTAGSKSSALPPLLCGFALAGAVAAVQRRWRVARRAVAVCVAMGAVIGLGSLLLYGGSYGLRIYPLYAVLRFGESLLPGLIEQQGASTGSGFRASPGAVAAVAVAVLAPSLLAWVGLGWLLRRRTGEPITWIVVGTCAAGLGAALAFGHPGLAQIYALIGVFPLGVVGSAIGLTWWLGPAAVSRPGRWTVAAGGLAGVAVSLAVAALVGNARPQQRWAQDFGGPPGAQQVSVAAQAWGLLGPYAVLALLLGTLGIVVWCLARLLQHRPWERLVPLAVVSALLGTGVLGTALHITGTPLDQTGTPPPDLARVYSAGADDQPPALSRDQFRAARWLREHAAPGDVLAVNRACSRSAAARGDAPCEGSSFHFAALAGRRASVEGWIFSGRALDSAWTSTSAYKLQPFWDPERLAEQNRAFTAPTPQLLADLHREGIRWLVADRRGQEVSPRLDALAVRRLTLPTVTVWELPG